jgi:hypothetical protein
VQCPPLLPSQTFDRPISLWPTVTLTVLAGMWLLAVLEVRADAISVVARSDESGASTGQAAGATAERALRSVLADEMRRGTIEYHSTTRRCRLNEALPDDLRDTLLALASS